MLAEENPYRVSRSTGGSSDRVLCFSVYAPNLNRGGPGRWDPRPYRIAMTDGVIKARV